MYKFARLRALLWSLSVTPTPRSKALIRWAVRIFGFALTICFALALLFRTSHDWPITWQDISMRDEVARSFLLSCFVWLTSGITIMTAILLGIGGGASRIKPPPAIASALRKAMRDRDSRIAAAEQIEAPASESTTNAANPSLTSRVRVATPELMTRPLALALVVFAAGMLAVAFVGSTLWFGAMMLGEPPDTSDSISGAEMIYSLLREVGMFAPLALWALHSAWRLWVQWLAGVRGATVTLSADGLTVRDQATLWRRRFIPWRSVVSLARFTYNDAYVRPRIVYLLDAGDQTFLWESPPDMRYEAPARRARIAVRQASAAHLLERVRGATELPLLNISGIVSAVAKIEPDPHSRSSEPDPRDTALLDFIQSAASGRRIEAATAPLPSSTKQ